MTYQEKVKGKLISGYVYSVYGNGYHFIPNKGEDCEEKAYELMQDDINYIKCKGLEPEYQTRPCKVFLTECQSGEVITIKAKLK